MFRDYLHNKGDNASLAVYETEKEIADYYDGEKEKIEVAALLQD